MFLFGKSKKSKKEEDVKEKVVSASDIYIRNVEEYIIYYGKMMMVKNPLDDKEFYEKYAVFYYRAAMEIVEFINENYPDSKFVGDEVIDFDYEGLLEKMRDETKSLFFKPNFPELIYIDAGRYSTHFHVQEDKVCEAEFVQVLPGLSRSLANEKINKLFTGLGVVELRDLLVQMNILPKDSELEETIEKHRELSRLNDKFLESVIALLLVVDRGRCTLKRARLFADSLGINFNFKPFEELEERKNKELALYYC